MDNEIKQGNIAAAHPSPWIDEKTGVIHWYYMDTFPFTLTINLTDKDSGEPIVFDPEDEIFISFFDTKRHEELIFTATCTNIPEDNTMTIDFTEEVSERFVPGKYSFCIRYKGEFVRTIGANCRIEVEKCH